MIEIFGQSAVNTAVKAGLDKFYSLFLRRPTGATGGLTATPRAYVTSRGILIRKEDTQKPTVNIAHDGYYFQFNPERVSDSKGTEYSTVPYPGLNYNDYAWGHGGERIISFQLFLDDTPASHTAGFRPESYGSQLAWGLETEGDTMGRKVDFLWKPTNAFSKTRISERGVMDAVDKITQFLYPAYTEDERPRFASGGIVDDVQFRPPSTAVLVLGPRYFEGIVKAAPVEYTLFDSDLTPIRATVNVEFAVYEFADVRSIYEKKLNQV